MSFCLCSYVNIFLFKPKVDRCFVGNANQTRVDYDLLSKIIVPYLNSDGSMLLCHFFMKKEMVIAHMIRLFKSLPLEHLSTLDQSDEAQDSVSVARTVGDTLNKYYLEVIVSIDELRVCHSQNYHLGS